MNYHPQTHRALTFHDARPAFVSGEQTPTAYLEACLKVIAAREPEVLGWVVLNEAGARAAAEASTLRYRQGRPLSSIDGMPVGIKDLIETRDLPTQMGSAAFSGNFPRRDSAIVRALREAGAIIVGKTVTTALGLLDPGPTRNPFDGTRTPGGSSSGSGAVVGAGMVPVAIGTQLVGSVLRPASFNGNWALKPTFGAINRGERLGFSQSTMGVHANAPEDVWLTACEVVARVGGDPGHPGLAGTATAPTPRQPATLAVLETQGWANAEPPAREAFEQALAQLAGRGVKLIRRRDSAPVEALEQALAAANELAFRLVAWEQRWSLENLVEQHPDTLGPSLASQLELGRSMTLDAYRAALIERAQAVQRLAALAPHCDALISLTAGGPAPLLVPAGSVRYPTGDVSFACVSSVLGAPAVNIPALAVDGLPLGLQLIGQLQQDQQITGYASWLGAALRGAWRA